VYALAQPVGFAVHETDYSFNQRPGMKRIQLKPLLHWSLFSRFSLALGLSIAMWALLFLVD
jgi:hypothetical protein